MSKNARRGLPAGSLPALGLVCAVLLLSAGCTVDDPQVNDVGTVSLFPVNPGVVPQSIVIAPGGTTTENRVQTMQWNITTARLTFGGQDFDLLFDPDPDDTMVNGDCMSMMPPSRFTLNLGTCVEGLILEATDVSAGATATLFLEYSVRVKRVIPIVYPFIGDEDGDGILNGNDNCILIANPGQEDIGNTGIGNDCRTVDFFNGVQLDSDDDGIPDIGDNCVHRPNSLQVNPPASEFAAVEIAVSDGIGFACEDNTMNPTPYREQIIDMPNQTLTRDFSFVLPAAQGFVVVDFNDEVVFPNCEWTMGTCSGFDPNAIQVCVLDNLFDAAAGCS